MKKFLVFLFVLVVSVSLIFSTLALGKTVVIVWGLNDAVPGGGREMVREFNRTHPDIEIKAQAQVIGGSGTTASIGVTPETMQKLMTAVAAGNPPDVYYMDRFVVAGYAARNVLTPLDEFVKKSNFNPNNYFKVCIDEAKFNGHLYALPFGTDDRIFYWNKEVFREAGFNPEKQPFTWDELHEYAIKLTKYDDRGNYKTIGFIPMYGNSRLYLWGWQNGGEIISSDGKKITINSKEFVEALEYLVKVYDALGGAQKIAAFSSSFQAGQMDPFLTGKVAMFAQGNWFIQDIARYKPDLDFGIGPIPVPKERYEQKGRFKGQPKFISWSGGWSWVIPKGAKNPEAAWEVIKWFCSPAGFAAQAKGDYEYNKSINVPYVPTMTGNKIADVNLKKHYISLLKNDNLKNAWTFAQSMMKYSRYRPITIVAAELYSEQFKAVDNAIFHKMSAKEALDLAVKNSQEALDKMLATLSSK